MAQSGDQLYVYAQPSNEHSVHPLDVGQLTTYHFDDEDSSVLLNSAVHESDMIQQPHGARYQRDSLMHHHAVMSPASSQAWDQSYQPAIPMEHISSAPGHSHPHFHDAANLYRARAPLLQSRTPAGAAFQSPTSWPQHYDASSAMDMVVSHPQHDTAPYTPAKTDEHGRQHDLAAQPFAQQHVPVVNKRVFDATPQVQTPISPQNTQEWMTLAQQEIESRPISKRMRPTSPHRPILDMRRDGGIQKKNKRIEIPQERNIQTIDQMIENTKDEDLLKELKAQKRLLRNREAALASRQRKKKHTEDLETSEKSYVHQITALEKDADSLALERNNLLQERQILIHRQQDAERVIEAMHMEKRDLIMKHTEETASLRKKVQVLMDQLEAAAPPAMSAAPSSTGYTDFNAEMEALSMGAHDWDQFMLINDMHHDQAAALDFSTPHGEPAMATTDTEAKHSIEPIALPPHASAPSDKPIASGLLFMLLLCGAYVASQPGAVSSFKLPPMPLDVQAAAPTVLHNLLAEDSIASVTHGDALAKNVLREPVPSTRALRNARGADRMTQVHTSLTAPTRQQEIDAAFALTPSQYASLMDSDAIHGRPSEDGHATPRQSLAEALTGYQPITGQNKAEVYTRSLLWNQIPAEVVQQFKRMVQSRADLAQHNQA